jgi:hypothetical protein
MAAVPVANGVDDGRFVNGHDNPDPYWATVPHTYVHLWAVEYYHVLRGWVPFKTVEHRCYGDLDTV